MSAILFLLKLPPYRALLSRQRGGLWEKPHSPIAESKSTIIYNKM